MLTTSSCEGKSESCNLSNSCGETPTQWKVLQEEGKSAALLAYHRDLGVRLCCSANLIFILKDRRAGRNAMSSVTYCVCWERGYYSKEGHRLGSYIRLSWPMGKACIPGIRRWDSHISGAHFSFQLQVHTIKNYFNTIDNVKLLEFSCIK